MKDENCKLIAPGMEARFQDRFDENLGPSSASVIVYFHKMAFSFARTVTQIALDIMVSMFNLSLHADREDLR